MPDYAGSGGSGLPDYFWLARAETTILISVVHREGCAVMELHEAPVYLGTLYTAKEAIHLARLRYGVESLPCACCLTHSGKRTATDTVR